MKIWAFKPKDAQGCFDVFRQAVHYGTHDFYSQEQRWAWCPYDPDAEVSAAAEWAAKLDQKISLVAAEGTVIQGFMVLHADGFLDYAFVRPAQMGTGLAGELYTRLEDAARGEAMAILETEASHLFRRFLLRRGWAVNAAQHAIRDSVAIENFRMSKVL